MQLARRFSVQPETIEGWRTEALEGMREAMRRGTGVGSAAARGSPLLRGRVEEGPALDAHVECDGEERRRAEGAFEAPVEVDAHARRPLPPKRHARRASKRRAGFEPSRRWSRNSRKPNQNCGAGAGRCSR